MPTLRRISVRRLFGYVDHDINIRESRPTIITAPNGAGKTHVLLIARAVLALDTTALSSLPFASAELYFDASWSIRVSRILLDDGVVELNFELMLGGALWGEPVQLRIKPGEVKALPGHIEPMGNGNWYDARRGAVVSTSYLRHIYRAEMPDSPDLLFRNNKAIPNLLLESHPILIDTKRLDPAAAGADPDVRRGREGETGAASINRYINRIRAEVVSARERSIRETQSSDLSFAARALAAASLTVNERKLHHRYDDIVRSYERLSRNGLAVGEAPLEFPARTTPTVRRILSVFLDDWERRLRPLLPINVKLETLRDILDSKLKGSGKRTTIDRNGRLGFETHSGRRINVSSLSSGEQHLVALFTMLLFASREDSVVFIDEPEISMHAAWKHAFLDDITRVSEIAHLQIILATHSTAIINGNWDLEEPLDLGMPGEDGQLVADEPDLESDEIF